MGRAKIDATQELESESKKRSTFKQRGGGLQKKFDEMGILCGVEGLLIAHGPQGELIDSCSNSSMPEVYQRFIERKYKHMLPLPDVNDIQAAINGRVEGHVQGSEKEWLEAEFVEHMDRIPLEESMSPVTVEELKTLHEDHVGLLAEAVEANLEAIRDFQEQQLPTTTTTTASHQMLVEGEERRMDHDGLQTTDDHDVVSPGIVGSTSRNIQILSTTDDGQDDEVEDEQVLPHNQFTPGVDAESTYESQHMNNDDIYTPMSADPELLLVDNNSSFHTDELFEFDREVQAW